MPGTEREVAIEMADGVRLAATLYLPDEHDGPQPCLLEALPYRKDDLTSSYAESYVELRDEHGHLLARGDMTFRRRRPEAPVAVLEADGRGPHDAPDALYRDRWRANALVALGHPVTDRAWADTLSRLAVPTMVRAVL